MTISEAWAILRTSGNAGLRGNMQGFIDSARKDADPFTKDTILDAPNVRAYPDCGDKNREEDKKR